jgi:hypothetical protein
MKILESLFSQNYSRKLSRIIKDPKLLGSLIKEHQLTASEKLLIPKDFYVVGNSVAQLLKIILGKTSLKTAYLGCDLLQYTENFLDFGWKYEDARYCFFENHPEDSFHPYNPIDALEVEHFDVLLLGERNPNKKKQILHGIKNKKCLVIDLLEFVELFQNSLQIKKKHFNSCLNLNKLITVAFFTYLCPPNPYHYRSWLLSMWNNLYDG